MGLLIPPENQTHQEYKEFLKSEEAKLRIGFSTHIVDDVAEFLKTFSNSQDRVIHEQIVEIKSIKTWYEIKVRTIFI